LSTITLTSPLTDPAKNDAEHTRYHGQDSLFLRHPSNPILSGKDWPYPVNSVFNAGVVRLDDGDTLLLCRVEDRRGLSHLCAARSANGILLTISNNRTTPKRTTFDRLVTRWPTI